VFFAAMLLQFGGRPLPEAWTVVEARPWPVRERAPRQQRPPMRGLRRGSSDSSPVPAPVAPSGPSPSASKKRKRRR
jgi:hypothetical protein